MAFKQQKYAQIYRKTKADARISRISIVSNSCGRLRSVVAAVVAIGSAKDCIRKTIRTRTGRYTGTARFSHNDGMSSPRQ